MEKQTKFGYDYKQSIIDWGADLLSYDGTIVAIARKTPRLFELAVREKLIDKSILESVVSERGLVFRSSMYDSQIVTICDDIIIHGSTFHFISSAIKDLLPEAKIIGYPFSINDKTDTKDMCIPTSFKKSINMNSCTAFENEIIASLTNLNKPYDIDHPIIYLSLPKDASITMLESYISDYSKLSNCSFYPSHRESCNYDGTIKTNHSWTIMPISQLNHDLNKIRIYYDDSESRLVIVPISPVIMNLENAESLVCQMPDCLITCWNEILSNTLVTRDFENKNVVLLRDRALVVMLNYLIELSNLLSNIRSLSSHLCSYYYNDIQPMFVDRFDLQLLVGDYLSSMLDKNISYFINDFDLTTLRHIESIHVDNPLSLIPPEYNVPYELTLKELVNTSHNIQELVSAIAQAQHLEVELPSRLDKKLDPMRLEFGVSFQYIENIANQVFKSNDNSFTQINKAIDVLVDIGALVPKYIEEPFSKLWFRSFRVGEGQDEITAYITINCFNVLKGVFNNENTPETMFEKYVVLLSDHLQAFNDPSLICCKPPIRGWHLYGARPMVQLDDRNRWLLNWAEKKQILILSKGQGLKSNYTLNTDYVEKYYKKDGNPLSQDCRFRLLEIANWLKSAHAKIGFDFIVAITTVESQYAFEQAILAEVKGWLDNNEYSVQDALNSLHKVVKHSNNETIKNAQDHLSRLAEWITQARKKYLLHEKLVSFILDADKIWAEDSFDIEASTWHKHIKPVLMARQREYCTTHNQLNYLFDLLKLVHTYTTLLRNILSTHNNAHDKRAITITEAIKNVVDFNKLLPNHYSNILTPIFNALEMLPEEMDFDSAVHAVTKPTLMFVDAVREIITLYPNFSNDVFDEVEEILYILFWDVNRSQTQDSLHIDELNRNIIEINYTIEKSYNNKLYQFNHQSADDGNLLIVDSYDIVCNVVDMITNHFKQWNVNVTFGCATTLDSTLKRSRITGILSGRAFAYAARIQRFFKEKNEQTWSQLDNLSEKDKALEMEPNQSYLILSEMAYRYACDNSDVKISEDYIMMPGMYKPRMRWSVKKSVYIKLL